jgi:hypothetical protein
MSVHDGEKNYATYCFDFIVGQWHGLSSRSATTGSSEETVRFADGRESIRGSRKRWIDSFTVDAFENNGFL